METAFECLIISKFIFKHVEIRVELELEMETGRLFSVLPGPARGGSRHGPIRLVELFEQINIEYHVSLMKINHPII